MWHFYIKIGPCVDFGAISGLGDQAKPIAFCLMGPSFVHLQRLSEERTARVNAVGSPLCGNQEFAFPTRIFALTEAGLWPRSIFFPQLNCRQSIKLAFSKVFKTQTQHSDCF